MDILGFFDGLLSAFSAARSGKQVDEQKSTSPNLSEKISKESRADAIKANKEQIRAARQKQVKNKQNEKDIR